MLIIKYITLSVSLGFISWIIGLLINANLMETEFYKKRLVNLNFIRSKWLNRVIGIGVFKWIVKNTFFRFFNQKITLKGSIRMSDLTTLRKEMTKSEIDHLIGFVFVMIFVVVKFASGNFLFGFIILVINILMNLYPSLLQQENKRRIDRLVNRWV